MPQWTLADLMSLATARIGQRSEITLSIVSTYVNMAYQEIAQAQQHAMLESVAVSSTTSGSSRITLPTDCMRLLGVSWVTTALTASTQTLRRMAPADADSLGFGVAVRQSDRYMLYSNYLDLWPSPDSAYSLQLRYIAYPSDMTATTAVPSLATEWRPAILYLSEALLHEHIGNEAEGANARTRYLGYVSTLENTEARRQAAGGLRASLPLRRSRY